MAIIGKFFKRIIGAFIFASGSVEKSALSQGEGENLGAGPKEHRRHRQGSLADSLNQGVVNQQVKELRWRMYEVLEKSQNYKTKIIGQNEDGTFITETEEMNHKDNAASLLNKVKIDEFDNYDLELVVINDEISIGVNEAIDSMNSDSVTKNYDEKGNLISVTHGEINGEKDESSAKTKRPIECTRELRQKFEIEKFAKKMNIRKISDRKWILHFYKTQ